MGAEENDLELRERLNLIESMIAEGRHSTQRWAWVFLLWGVAYYIAIAWSVWGHSDLAWPVTMIVAAIATGIGSSRLRRGQPGCAIGRTLCAIWAVMGTVLFIILMVLGLSGHSNLLVVVAIAGAMLAVANGISSIVLRWKMQFACALIWLALAISACFATEMQIAISSLAAIFFCQIVFGIYAMAQESRHRKQNGVAHA